MARRSEAKQKAYEARRGEATVEILLRGEAKRGRRHPRRGEAIPQKVASFRALKWTMKRVVDINQRDWSHTNGKGLSIRYMSVGVKRLMFISLNNTSGFLIIRFEILSSSWNALFNGQESDGGRHFYFFPGCVHSLFGYVTRRTSKIITQTVTKVYFNEEGRK